MDNSPNVWFWPDGLDTDAAGESAEQPGESGWLGYLCSEFDVVLLDCRATDFTTTAAEVAAMADAAVLVVEAAETPKQQIQRVQHILEMSGVRLAGCILMQRR
jgi:Mrp family chromosome partitioning ATPase